MSRLVELNMGLAAALAKSAARFAPSLAGELESEASLELCVAASEYTAEDGEFPDYAAARIKRHLNRIIHAERNHACREHQPDDHSFYESSAEAHGSGAVSGRTHKRMTPGQRRRFRRNLCIVASCRAGISQRIIAEVFDLPRSRIAGIIREVGQMVARPADPED